jgi:hypothetical protein
MRSVKGGSALTDAVLAPLVYPAALLLRAVRKAGIARLPRCRAALLRAGVFPIRDHYYEPRFDLRTMRRPLDQARPLPGIEWNVAGQLALLEKLRWADELTEPAGTQADGPRFSFRNSTFGPGDAEFWYQLIRLKKPRRIFEIGSGNSSLMAMQAIRRNQRDDGSYACKHVCVEPYEMPWLEQTSASIVRAKVEDLDVGFFAELDEDDVLFIDSSHVIKPDGDVLFEYLELLPTLKPGVIVHVHDIFSPSNYPAQWLVDEVRLWNEQYLLEAFLTGTSDWQVVASLNYLRHHHYEALQSVAPFLTPDREPGSFYLQRRA